MAVLGSKPWQSDSGVCVPLTTLPLLETGTQGVLLGYLVTNSEKRKPGQAQKLGRNQTDIRKEPTLDPDSLAYTEAVSFETPHCPVCSRHRCSLDA